MIPHHEPSDYRRYRRSIAARTAGSLDLEGVREIETAFLAHVTFAKRPVILDSSQVTFLASFGMRMLFEAIRALGRQGKRLAILKPQPMVAHVLELGSVSSAAVISFDGADARSKLH
jgi:anti-anti-sigma factor